MIFWYSKSIYWYIYSNKISWLEACNQSHKQPTLSWCKCVKQIPKSYHNNAFDSSRRVQMYLKTVANISLLYDRQHLALKGHCESQSSCNRGKLSRNYQINVVAKHDKIVSAVPSSLHTLFYLNHLVICLGWYVLVRANALYHHFTRTASPKYMYPIELWMHNQLSTTIPTHPPVQQYIYYVSLSHHQILKNKHSSNSCTTAVGVSVTVLWFIFRGVWHCACAAAHHLRACAVECIVLRKDTSSTYEWRFSVCLLRCLLCCIW